MNFPDKLFVGRQSTGRWLAKEQVVDQTEKDFCAEYVRADLFGDLQAEVKNLRKALEDKECAVAHYHHTIDQIQGQTFYMENEEGVLCRWYPPRRLSFACEGESK